MDGKVEPYRPQPVGFLFDRPILHRSHGANLKPKAMNCYAQRARIPNAQLSGDCNKSDSGRYGSLPTAYTQYPTMLFSGNDIFGWRSARLAQGLSTIPLILKVQFSETVRD
jgi:hypothetical protein